MIVYRYTVVHIITHLSIYISTQMHQKSQISYLFRSLIDNHQVLMVIYSTVLVAAVYYTVSIGSISGWQSRNRKYHISIWYFAGCTEIMTSCIVPDCCFADDCNFELFQLTPRMSVIRDHNNHIYVSAWSANMLIANFTMIVQPHFI